MNDLFRFIGDQEEGLGYKYNRVYMLELMGRGMTLPVVVTAPIRCEYADYNTFLKNWERI